MRGFGLEQITTEEQWERFVRFYTKRAFAVSICAKIISALDPRYHFVQSYHGHLLFCPLCRKVTISNDKLCQCGAEPPGGTVRVTSWDVVCPMCQTEQRYFADGVTSCQCGWRDIFYLAWRVIQKALRANKDAAVHRTLMQLLYSLHKPQGGQESVQKTSRKTDKDGSPLLGE